MRTPEENKVYMRAYYIANKERMRAQHAAYNKENAEELRAWHKNNYENNKPALQQKMKIFRATHTEWMAQYKQAYYAANKADAVRRAMVRLEHILENATPLWADKRAIKAIYAEARRISKETGVPHEVDHIIPLFSPVVSGLHVHINLQILSRTENRAKYNKFTPG